MCKKYGKKSRKVFLFLFNTVKRQLSILLTKVQVLLGPELILHGYFQQPIFFLPQYVAVESVHAE